MAQEHEHERRDTPQGTIVPGGDNAESLRRANALLGGLIEGSRDLMAVQDTEFHFIAFNRAYQAEFKEVYGVQLKAGDSLLSLLDHLPEESRTARELWARTLRGEEFTETIEFGDPALGRRSYEIQSFPICDPAGRLIGGAHIARNVTVQGRAEMALRASEENYRRIIASSTDCIKVLDLDGRILSINPCGWRLMEIENIAQYLGLFWLDTWQGEGRQLAAEAMALARNGEIGHFCALGLTVKGNSKWWDETVSPILDAAGRPERLLVMANDITQRKQAEDERERLLGEKTLALAQLEAERQKLQAIIEHMPAGVIMTDAATEQRLLINEAAAEILGATLEPGSHTGEMAHQLLKADGQPYAYAEYPIVRTLRTGEIVRDEEIQIVRPDGEQRTVLTNSVPVRDAEGRIITGVVLFKDITERKRAEEAMLRFRIALDSAADNIFLIDPEILRFLDVSQSASRDLGYSREELLRLGPLDIMPQISKEELLSRFAAIQFDPSGQDAIETTHYRKDGTGFEVEVVLRPVEIQGRKLLVAVARDITERKRIEAALHESEAFLRKVLQHLPAGVSIVDAATQQYRIVNEQAEQILGEHIPIGAPLQGPTQFSIFRIDRTPYAVEDWPVLRSIRERQVIANEEIFILRGDGTCRTVLVNAAPLLNSGEHVKAGIVVFADISERQRMERELRQREEFSNSILNSMPAHVVVLDAQGTIVQVNEAWKRFARENGASDLERAYQGENYLDVCRRAAASGLPGGEAAQECLEKLQVLLNGALDQFDLEYPCHAPGEQRWFLLRATPGTHAGGFIVISHINITDRKHAEAALIAADRRKDEYLAMLAHELRNPLAPVRNAVQILKLAGANEAVREKNREIIERQVSHMARLLDDLLDIARITRGNADLKKSVVQLSDVFARAVESASPLVESRHHTLRVSPPDEELQVYADFDRLIQIVSNLLSNAAKYTEEAGTIWLEAATEGPEVVIRVRDTGVGIAPEMLPRVFDVFTQVTRTLDRSQGGLGLGLTLVRSLTQMHGGSVEARSAGLGQGSEFIVRLPALPAAQTSGQPQEGTPVQEQPHPHRILVVDDVADTADSLAELLGLLGHEVRTAYDGPAAIQIAREFEPDVILLDIGLPGEDGYEVARQLRREATMKGVILVALTGYGQEEDRRLAQQAGFDHLFTKPVELGALQSLLA